MNTAEQNYRLLQEIDAHRSFMLMAYQQNPKLLEQAEARIRQWFEGSAHRQTEVRAGFISPLDPQSALRTPHSAFRTPQSGASLIELIMFIVIVSVAVAGILLVMNVTTKSSADPLLNKQAMVAAYSLLEEVELQDFVAKSGVATAGAVTQLNRASGYHIVSEYNTFATTGIYSVTDAGSASAILPTYNASVAVVPEAAAWNGIAAGSAVQINVTVNGPNGESVTATGYRTAY